MFAEDLSVFFDAETHGVEAAFGADPVTVILDLAAEPVFEADGLPENPRILFVRADLPTLERGSTGTVKGIAVKVREVSPTADGALWSAALTRT